MDNSPFKCPSCGSGQVESVWAREGAFRRVETLLLALVWLSAIIAVGVYAPGRLESEPEFGERLVIESDSPIAMLFGGALFLAGGIFLLLRRDRLFRDRWKAVCLRCGSTWEMIKKSGDA